MKIKEIAKHLNLDVKTCFPCTDNDITGVYVSDLLSDVMANSKKDNLWITLQTHLNIVTVSKVKDLSGIIIVNNRSPDINTLKKAEEENVLIAITELSCFETAGRLYGLINR